MSKKTRKVSYIECDACGYELGERRMTLELQYKESETARGKLTFHFHEASDSHDCLRYWITGMGIMERSLKDVELLNDRGREVILKSVSGSLRKAAA